MKRCLLFICVLSLMVASFSFIASAATIDASMPRPESDAGTKYFCIGDYLIMFQIPSFYIVTSDHNSNNIQYVEDGLDVRVLYNTSPRNLTFMFTVGSSVYSNTSVDVWLYRLSTGNYSSHYSVSLQNGLGSWSFTLAASSNPSYFSIGCSLDDTFIYGNFPIADIQWSDTIDYSSDFTRISGILESIFSDLNLIIQQDDSYYDAVQEFINYFFLTSQDDLPAGYYAYNWDYFINKLDSFAYNSNQFYRSFNEWYTEEWRPTEQTKIDQLNQIIQNIIGDSNSKTWPGEPASNFNESADEYYEFQSEIFQDQSEELSNIAEDAFAGFNIDHIGEAMHFLKIAVEDFVYQYPIYAYLVTFAIVMGIAAMFLGRRLNG